MARPAGLLIPLREKVIAMDGASAFWASSAKAEQGGGTRRLADCHPDAAAAATGLRRKARAFPTVRFSAASLVRCRTQLFVALSRRIIAERRVVLEQGKDQFAGRGRPFRQCRDGWQTEDCDRRGSFGRAVDRRFEEPPRLLAAAAFSGRSSSSRLTMPWISRRHLRSHGDVAEVIGCPLRRVDVGQDRFCA